MKKAVVMAGGFGSRLYPLTVGCPKPMVPLVNKPVLAHILSLLKRHNFTDIVITVRYLAHQIQDYFGDGRHLGLNINYAIEDTPLGTAGGVKNAQPYLDDEPTLVISGDALTDIDLSSLVEFHKQNKSLVTMALKQVNNPREYGVAITDSEARVKQYLEKPKSGQLVSNNVNTGIYVLEPEILKSMQAKTAYDFSYDIFPQLLSDNAPFFGYAVDGYWRDIGTLESYVQANFDMLTGAVRQPDLGRYIGNGVWVGEGVDVASDVIIHGPAYLGHNVKIDQGVTITGPVVIGHRSVIDAGAHIAQAVIGKNCLIGKAVNIHKGLVPDHSILTTNHYSPKESLDKVIRKNTATPLIQLFA